jgi:hypothetical protein
MKVLGCSFVEEEVERERRERRQRRESIVIENRRVFELCY